MALDDALDDRQPDAGSREFARIVQPLERTKHARGVLHVESRAVVAHVIGAQRAAPTHFARSTVAAATIRQTTLRTAAEELEAVATGEKAKKQIEAWRKTADRYQNEPETREGREQLAERAKNAERKRDKAFAAYHHFELSAAAVQIAIVLASASIVTAIPALAWTAGALGAVGIAFCVIGFWFPTSVHLF